MSLGCQTRWLLEKLGTDSPFASHIQNTTTTRGLLDALSQLLVTPAFTLLVAHEFRPVLFDLCARWLLVDGRTDEILVALCLLLEPHPELFPILNAFMKKTYGPSGPLNCVEDQTSFVDQLRLHLLLLSYYRILQANRTLPKHFSWPISTLAKIFTTSGIDTGARLLAIRCYFLQSGMGEAERIKLEQRYVGDIGTVDCPVSYSVNADGSICVLDGWILPAVEATRIADFWKSSAGEVPDYYRETEGVLESFSEDDLSPFTVNVSGIFLLRDHLSPPPPSGLVQTDGAQAALRELALLYSLRHPTLLTSPPSSGKSLLIHHLSSLLHPRSENHVVTIHLADTSLDPRSLLGSHVSSATKPGTFEWKEGVLVKAMKQGKWIVFKDIDRGSNDVLGVIKPLVESIDPGNWIGRRGTLNVPGHEVVIAHDSFAIFATRSVPSKDGKHPKPAFFGSHKFAEVTVPSPSRSEVEHIVNHKFPRLSGRTSRAATKLWEELCDTANNFPSLGRGMGIRELGRFAARINRLAPVSSNEMEVNDFEGNMLLSSIFTHVNLKEEVFLYARDVFFGAGTLTSSPRQFIEQAASIAGHHIGLSAERQATTLHSRVPEFDIERDVNGRSVAVRVDRARLVASPGTELLQAHSRPFAMHKPAIRLMDRLATSISLGEPILLTGETGTGKTSAVTHLAAILRKPLIPLNLSQQTESSDILGGFKPIDARVPGMKLYQTFMWLFGVTLSSKKNPKFQESVRKAVLGARWKRAVALWTEAIKIAKEKLRAKAVGETRGDQLNDNQQGPRKRQRVEEANEGISEADWDNFEQELRTFDIQHVQGKGKFAFAFVEGPLVKALRSGDWILLDEINLASTETLECISSLLQSDTSSITLTEQGSLEPIPRHPDFRIFACMNPATDVGKKDLPANIRSRFTEIDVPPPDADRETLLSIIEKYIGHCTVGDKGAIMDIADFYLAIKTLSDQRKIADGENRRPYYSIRTLVRSLMWASDATNSFGLRRALWEGCLMAFTMTLDLPSAEIWTTLARQYLLANVKNVGSLLARQPIPPTDLDDFVKVGPFYLARGPLPSDPVEEYIVTPSVERKLVDLARIIVGRRFPILIEGPTSTGKTSSIEYLAKRTGHRFVRINNHEHTDIQEYLGTYISDSTTGRLIFQDGLLVRALRRGDWIVLDELNLAPTDVLEALNRLLDDNRELVIPETQEVVHPHPNFLLFATQNPPGLYGGRKVLSRAFRNRFLEVYFDDLPQAELETILCQRCRIAPSYAQKIVRVFRELTKRRQSTRVFESKHGFATLRDLFRWAGRDAVGYQQLAENGYMLLAERARRVEDKAIVKEVIEAEMNVRIDEDKLYGLQLSEAEFSAFLGPDLPVTQIIWTGSMRRLYLLVLKALRSNEPVLLVGETGCGKTSVCQMYADAKYRNLYSVNCHQNTETADLIGALRPIRNRATLEAEATQEATKILIDLGVAHAPSDIQGIQKAIVSAQKSVTLAPGLTQALQDVLLKFRKLSTMFEWHDGPLVQAMMNGDVFLLDEISLADDSVLERLNSVLEPSRMMVLAERGGESADTASITGADGFQVVATMNPGGDYGKKELSPAMRNRFTEIWVPSTDQRKDLETIADGSWSHDELRPFTQPLLDFIEWLAVQASDRSLISLRDILAWIAFSNTAHEQGILSACEIFHQAACMTYVDGISAFPQFSSFTLDSLRLFKKSAMQELQRLVPLASHGSVKFSLRSDDDTVHIGPFSVRKGDATAIQPSFDFGAPTTLSNAMRVIRACQLNKPILLEGSPGVGKTSLVTALASVVGQTLSRINLSDQTDLIDLFGSDLPVEGGAPGQFVWKDAEFLRALQEGHWVLLDEMNLAPQAVLEGLNSVLDHRGTVYIPELGRSFQKHPSFRIFAAQNPQNQGGGRKGLPKSFVNRFTKVYVEELHPNDQLLISKHLFPDYPIEWLEGMVAFNSRLNEEIVQKKTFAREGGPWEFNLRDLIRWGSLLKDKDRLAHPSEYLRTLYLHRFRTPDDREKAVQIFMESLPFHPTFHAPRPSISPSYLQIGAHLSARKNFSPQNPHPPLLPSHLEYLETIATCSSRGWLVILTGERSSGKSGLLRILSKLSGNFLQEIAVNSITDTTDILGSFDQVGVNLRLDELRHKFDMFLDMVTRCSALIGTQITVPSYREIWTNNHQDSLMRLKRFISGLPALQSTTLDQVKADLLTHVRSTLLLLGVHGRFEWVDGPLVRALKEGSWVVLDGANLCSPSVLDRLNSLCESDGVLTLNERGSVNGGIEIVRPHPNFRLFMIVDPQHGELSRAMRNRGVEVALLGPLSSPINPTQDFTNAQAFRLGLTSARTGLAGPSPDTRLITQDCIHSTLISQSIPLASTHSLGEAALHFIARITPSAYLPYAIRFWGRSVLYGHLDSSSAVQSILQPLYEGSFSALFSRLRHRLGRKWNIPSDFLSFQPQVITLNSLPCFAFETEDADNKSHTTQAIGLLNLLVELRVWTITAPKRDVPATAFSQSTITDEVLALVSSVSKAVGDVLDIQSTVDPIVVTTAVQLLRFSKYLSGFIVGKQIDHSALQVVVGWINEALKTAPSGFEGIAIQAEKLDSIVRLSSGCGFYDIWNAFLTDVTQPTDSQPLEILGQVASISGNTNLRSQAFQFAALCTLPVILSDHEVKVVQDLREKFQKLLASPHYLSPSAVPTSSFWLAQINVLQTMGYAGDPAPRKFPGWYARRLLNLVVQDSTQPLQDFLALQQLSWATSSSQLRVPYVIRVQRQWLESAWRRDGTVQDEYALDLPVSTRNAVAVCDPSGMTLSQVAEYASTVDAQLKLTISNLEIHTTRKTSLTGFLIQSIIMLLSSLGNKSQDFHGAMQTLSNRPDLGTPESVGDLLDMIPAVQHVHLDQSHVTMLIEALTRLRSHDIALRETGLAWITFSKLVITAYIPNVPLDPLAARRCAVRFWKAAEEQTQSQLDLHVQHEKYLSGNTSNVIIRLLETQLLDVRERLAAVSIGRHWTRETEKLGMYWTEVSKFVSQVLLTYNDYSAPPVDHVPRELVQREEMFQESLSGFCHRLETVYPEYNDISTPVIWAIFHMKLGVRLAFTRPSSNPHSNALSKALMSVPSILGTSTLIDTTVAHQSDSATSLHLGLSAIALEISSGVDRRSLSLHAVKTYDHLVGLWLADREKGEVARASATSLYRTKRLPSSEEEEEAEFSTLFPDFSDSSGDVDSPQPTLPSTVSSPLTPSGAEFLQIHRTLMSPSPGTGFSSFQRLSKDYFTGFLREKFPRLSHSLDDTGVLYQSLLLKDRLDWLRRPVDKGEFYHGSNVCEASRVTPIVRSLQDRLSQLIAEWPDQMVLQHLRDTCDTVLALPLTNPLPRVLASLERLLLQTDDWEMCANRENTLAQFRQNLTELIVDWRRLELACWKSLLETERLNFVSGVADWWLQLYETLVRGSYAAAEQSLSDNSAFSQYMDSVVPLIDQLMHTSPLGQFPARIQLLYDFEHHLRILSQQAEISKHVDFERVARILHHTWNHYRQFSATIEEHFSRDRATQEGDIQGLIKLASWRDTNVRALQQSAKKTHHQLYKSIRKFREILRQPASDFFGVSGPSDLERKLTTLENYSAPTDGGSPAPPFPEVSTLHIKVRRLSGISHTFARFDHLLSHDLRAFITNSSPKHVDQLAVELILASEDLSKETVPSSLPKEKREKGLKALLVRKKKAFSDYLKELKRCGLSSSVKPDVLSQNRSQRWVREQPILSVPAHWIARSTKGEDYFYRIASLLPEVRLAAGKHHQDVTSHECQRAVGLLESAFSNSLASRSSLSAALEKTEVLRKFVHRLQGISRDQSIITCGGHVEPPLRFAKDSCHRLRSAMSEVKDAISALQQTASWDDFGVVTTALESNFATAESMAQAIRQVYDRVTSTTPPVLLQEELSILNNVISQAEDISTALKSLARGHGFTHHFASPLWNWIDAIRWPCFISTDVRSNSDIAATQVGLIIDTMLIDVQEVLKSAASNEPTEDPTAKDRFLTRGLSQVMRCTQSLNLGDIITHLQQLLTALSSAPFHETLIAVGYILPFLERYLVFVDSQLTNHHHWTNTLFKLTYVSCSIAQRICNDGFCQPSPESEGQEGEGKESADDVGIGEGTGKENISEEIKEESQVEGLQDAGEGGDAEREDGDDKAIEMSQDIGGELEGVEGQEEGEDDDESGDESEVEDKAEDFDANDPRAVDEKLWGDEHGKEPKDSDDKLEKDHSSQQQQGSSEIVAKENEGAHKGEKGGEDQAETAESDMPEDALDVDKEQPAVQGTPIEGRIDETETLDLPEDLQMGEDEVQKGDDDDDISGDDEGDPEEEVVRQDPFPDQEDVSMSEETAQGNDEPETDQTGRPGETDADDPDSNQKPDLTNPDLHGGADQDRDGMAELSADTNKEDGQASEESKRTRGGKTGDNNEEQMTRDANEHENDERKEGGQGNDTGNDTSNLQSQGATAAEKLANNPLRSLGDALKEVRRNLDQILESSEVPEPTPIPSMSQESSQLQYSHPEDQDQDMEGLGAAGEEEAARLNDLTLLDEAQPVVDTAPMEIDETATEGHQSQHPSSEPRPSQRVETEAGVDGGLTRDQITDLRETTTVDEQPSPDDLSRNGVPRLDEQVSEDVEVELRSWQANDYPLEGAQNMWRLYESLTHDLSYTLCEQLRSILEPTQATRLKGDYRTGKRLNMKKIIPYIASEYTKDKIWLRRTKPSQREYQVLIALDDSRSMAESHSVHLAYQTLALVSRALARLEVGDIGIAKFGETVEVLHGFDNESGPFNDQAGVKLLNAFRFNQKATDLLGLIETSLKVLEQARDRRSMRSASAADLWQLEIIISDGVCQDLERIKTVLRRAEEQRVMIVFVILDSLHSHIKTGTSSANTVQNSILTMQQGVVQKNANGVMEVKMERYLDLFPFEYYVVLRDVEALPDILSGTLKQFFECISED
ncbi:P-loop containing nucleoside triphosphate hydrolase protein [Thelephora ganbajun]|uniref:P-loop containing nucleoside triphosphate hydrolase protein n=1 Tax=Thelephora ganbajun TaxID=370292 RepID=A0ACB6ZNY0_THEGA|nr:P-loop containing nucleoside triphosphate hydrolase protein [Thelephora ganbajun]